MKHLVKTELKKIEDNGYPPLQYKPILNSHDLIHGETPIFKSRSADSVQLLLEEVVVKSCIKLDLERTQIDRQPLLHYCVEAAAMKDRSSEW